RGFSYLRAVHVPVRTYEVGLVLMAIGAQYEHAEAPPADPPKEGAAPEAAAASADDVSKEDREWMTKEVAFLEKKRASDGLWGYPDAPLGWAVFLGKYDFEW